MRILFTGSEGSLAQMIIPHMLAGGHDVVGCDNFSRYGRVERKRDYEFSSVDLCDSDSVKALFAGRKFDVVFHLAALVYGVVGFHKKPADIIADNNLTTINLLKSGHNNTGKFIYLSSSMVYEKCSSFPHKEEDADNSIVMSTSYGLSKYIGERVVRSYHEQYNTSYTIWRPFNIITPFETPEEEGFSHVFTDMVDKILVKKQNPISVLGDGEQIRCFTNIYDVADAIAKFSTDKRSENGIFNIGNKEPVSVKELVNRIVAIAKKLDILESGYSIAFKYQPVYSDDVRKRIPDVSKMKNIFGWEAETRLDESLESYIKARFNKR